MQLLHFLIQIYSPFPNMKILAPSLPLHGHIEQPLLDYSHRFTDIVLTSSTFGAYFEFQM